MAPAHEIELLDVAAPRPAAPSEAVVRPSFRWLGPALGIAVLLWVVAGAGTNGTASDEDTPAADSIPVGENPAPSPPADLAAVVAPATVAWPEARTHDPAVTTLERLPPAPTSLASLVIVYVSASGLPTVVSLDSGEVREVNVGATRIHDTFAVEAGQVVTFDEAQRSGSAAIVFHTYRDVDRPGIGTMSDQRGVGQGPELCLSAVSCRRVGAGLDRVRQGGVVAERFDPADHAGVAMMLDQWASKVSDRAPPVGIVWVIGPASGSSVSSTGVR